MCGSLGLRITALAVCSSTVMSTFTNKEVIVVEEKGGASVFNAAAGLVVWIGLLPWTGPRDWWQLWLSRLAGTLLVAAYSLKQMYGASYCTCCTCTWSASHDWGGQDEDMWSSDLIFWGLVFLPQPVSQLYRFAVGALVGSSSRPGHQCLILRSKYEDLIGAHSSQTYEAEMVCQQ